MSTLVALLPFEPRRPTLALLGLEVTLLEAVAGLVLVVLFVAHRSELRERVRAGPLALLCLSGYALVHAASAALAEEQRQLAWKFAARMAVMAVFGWLVAAAPAPARRRALAALVVSGAVVALLAVAEGMGLRGLDPVLAHFRETPFNVGGSRRATAGSEYPNQAAAFLMYALLAWAGLSQARRPWLALSLSALLSAGMLFTYSRGALVACGLGLLAALAAARSRPGQARGPRLALFALVLAAAVFAASGEVFRLRLESEGTSTWYGARYEPEDATLTFAPREARRLRVRVTNAGRKTWARQEAFHLSYHWYHPERRTLQDGGRTELPVDVPPGASVLLEAEVVAPDLLGRYRLVWDMVHEDTTWFSGQGVRPVVVDAFIGRPGEPVPGPASQLPPASLGWRPSRAELWRIALEMWGTHPVWGVGPDNFRWLYGRYAGEPFWDTRVFANNILLEAAATTGSLGLVALALTFMAALRASYRGLMAAPDASTLALFGMTVAVLAHGLVDYVLAFTGHYLFLGFLVGSIAARRESDLA